MTKELSQTTAASTGSTDIRQNQHGLISRFRFHGLLLRCFCWKGNIVCFRKILDRFLSFRLLWSNRCTIGSNGGSSTCNYSITIIKRFRPPQFGHNGFNNIVRKHERPGLQRIKKTIRVCRCMRRQRAGFLRSQKPQDFDREMIKYVTKIELLPWLRM